MKLLIPLTLACCVVLAQAQSFCSSDGQPTPTMLVERFISADCEACWSAPTDQQAVANADALVLDWIVPAPSGNDAPLSAAASRDALTRLEMQGLKAPLSWLLRRRSLAALDAQTLRVAHGLPLADYVGASIELSPARGGPWTAVLLLVESIPAGAEGSPLPRNLVRNMLTTSWTPPASSPPAEPMRYFESRPMSLPGGTHVDRLRAVGWVQDAQGVLVALAQSACQREAPN